MCWFIFQLQQSAFIRYSQDDIAQALQQTVQLLGGSIVNEELVAKVKQCILALLDNRRSARTKRQASTGDEVKDKLAKVNNRQGQIAPSLQELALLGGFEILFDNQQSNDIHSYMLRLEAISELQCSYAAVDAPQKQVHASKCTQLPNE